LNIWVLEDVVGIHPEQQNHHQQRQQQQQHGKQELQRPFHITHTMSLKHKNRKNKRRYIL
jgi:hypothetical protein